MGKGQYSNVSKRAVPVFSRAPGRELSEEAKTQPVYIKARRIGNRKALLGPERVFFWFSEFFVEEFSS